MKIIKTLFSVRFAALALVACTVFTGVMYRRQARELRRAEHFAGLLPGHLDIQQNLIKQVRIEREYSGNLEERLKAYEAAYPEPKGAAPMPTKAAQAGTWTICSGQILTISTP